MIKAMEREKQGRLDAIAVRQISKRVEKQLTPRYGAFMLSQRPDVLIPSLFEVCLRPEVLAIICAQPLDEPIPEEALDRVFQTLPSFADSEWQTKVSRLLAIVKQSKTYESQDPSADILSLASSIFSCQICQEKMTYPSVLTHGCNYIPMYKIELEPVEDPEYSHPVLILPPRRVTSKADGNLDIHAKIRVHTQVPAYYFAKYLDRLPEIRLWRGLDDIIFDDAGHQHVLAMLTVLKMDAAIPASEMEDLNPYVECVCQCYYQTTRNRPRTAMRWMKAVSLILEFAVHG